jgi:3,4-dihydroxy 2-butanone 4-phosphate synthase/GTP cyclohydrolase II
VNGAVMSQGDSLAGRLLYLGGLPLDTRHGEFVAHIAQNLASGAVAFAITQGNIRSPDPLLVRVHSSCVTSETFGGCDCDCLEQLDAALAQIAEKGRGVVFYLFQEGRGAGLVAKARDRMIVQASGHRVTTFEAYAAMGLAHDLRRYEEVGSFCRLLGVCASLTILTNNGDKLAAIQSDARVDIGGSAALSRPASPYNQHYLRSKSRFGHLLEDPEGQVRAALPERVEAFPPHALANDPRFILTASYFLPVRTVEDDADVDPAWFRVFVYYDLAFGAERVVLTFGSTEAAEPLVRVQRESLLERFPRADGAAKKLWYASVREFVRHGSGIATFISPDGFDAQLREIPGDAAASVRLVAHHLQGRSFRQLVFDGESDSVDIESLLHGATGASDVPVARNGSQRSESSVRDPG